MSKLISCYLQHQLNRMKQVPFIRIRLNGPIGCAAWAPAVNWRSSPAFYIVPKNTGLDQSLFLATSMTLQIYLAVGQLTSRLRKSSLPFLMHINTYFVIALPMCLTYLSILPNCFALNFFIIIFISFSSLSLQLQYLAQIGYKSSSTTHTLMLLAHSRICNPTFAPITFLPFRWSSTSTAVNPSTRQLPGFFFITFISLWLHQESLIFTTLFL